MAWKKGCGSESEKGREKKLKGEKGRAGANPWWCHRSVFE